MAGYMLDGRLRHASIPHESKHSLLLPHQHFITDLLIMFYHQKESHLGANHVIVELNKKYWIVRTRSAVRRCLDSCIPCRFCNAGAGSQQIGDLPPPRVLETQPFSVLGTNIKGPVTVNVGRSRVKRYICIFNCMATHAVHLEVVPSLNMNAFLQAYHRFCNRRNVNPKIVYSDNGNNFVAAEKVLKDKVKWCFNPPRTSQQGSFYEIFFELFCKIFRSIVVECTLTDYDHMYVAEIERIFNNRPITNCPIHRMTGQHWLRIQF